MLALQGPDGQWGGDTYHPYWTSTTFTLLLLRHLGLDPTSVQGRRAVTAARSRGEEYLLERRLFRRLSTGEVVKPIWMLFSFPPWWHYDVLRGLDYLRSSRSDPDERCGEAIELVLDKRGGDDRWPLENLTRGWSTSTWSRAPGHPADETRSAP